MICSSVLLRMKNISDKGCRENQNTSFVFSYLFSKIVPFTRKRGKILYSGEGHMTIWRMRIACWITKAANTHTHTHSVLLIAFPLQQWLHERPSMLHYTYIACLVTYIFGIYFLMYFFLFKVGDLQFMLLGSVYISSSCIMDWWWPEFTVETGFRINKNIYKLVGCDC